MLSKCLDFLRYEEQSARKRIDKTQSDINLTEPNRFSFCNLYDNSLISFKVNMASGLLNIFLQRKKIPFLHDIMQITVLHLIW